MFSESMKLFGPVSDTQKSFTSEAQVNPFVLKFLLLAVHLLYFELQQPDLNTARAQVKFSI
jgi:hypothetical protein